MPTNDRRLTPVATQAGDPTSDRAPAPPQVVILAAGMGTRLGRSTPKPLTPLHDGRTILQRQVDVLRAVLGADVDITVVVGFQCQTIMAAAPDLRFAYNPDFEWTNTSKSLLRGLGCTRPGGVLWLNGDVVFDPGVLGSALLPLRADESFVCVDTAVVGDEEVKYTLDDTGHIRELSKTVRGGLGEAVGINHVSAADRPALEAALALAGDQDYFEHAIEAAVTAGHVRFKALDVGSHGVIEVDDEHDLARANDLLVQGAPA